MKRLVFFVLSLFAGFLIHQYWILPSVPIKVATVSTVLLAALLAAVLYACLIFFFCLKIRKLY